jgi:hypothetical protein
LPRRSRAILDPDAIGRIGQNAPEPHFPSGKLALDLSCGVSWGTKNVPDGMMFPRRGAMPLEEPEDLPEGSRAIVKVQNPSYSRGRRLSVVVFAEGLRHFRRYSSEMLPSWVHEVMNGRVKAYFLAEVRNGEWSFLGIAEDQAWQ